VRIIGDAFGSLAECGIKALIGDTVLSPPSNPTPYTLHPTPYTLHPETYILHPKTYIPHPRPYILHPQTYIPHLSPEPETLNQVAASTSWQSAVELTVPSPNLNPQP